MKRVILLIGFLILVALQIFILGSDYWIQIGRRWAIYNDATPQREATLGFGEGAKQRVLDGITAYALVKDDILIGTCQTGHFVARNHDGVRYFGTVLEWEREVATISDRPPVLVRVSRFGDPILVRFQLALAITYLVVVAAFVLKAIGLRAARCNRHDDRTLLGQ